VAWLRHSRCKDEVTLLVMAAAYNSIAESWQANIWLAIIPFVAATCLDFCGGDVLRCYRQQHV
jgi:phosphatidylserine synthase